MIDQNYDDSLLNEPDQTDQDTAHPVKYDYSEFAPKNYDFSEFEPKQESVPQQSSQQKQSVTDVQQQTTYTNLFFDVIFFGLILTCFFLLKKIGLEKVKNFFSKNEITQLSQKSLIMLKEVNGGKRLLVALSILYLLFLVILIVNIHFSMIGLFFASMPVWLNWVAYWIFINLKQNKNISNELGLVICIFCMMLLLVFNFGYGGIFCLVSVPIWLAWLIYWVYLGFKKKSVEKK